MGLHVSRLSRTEQVFTHEAEDGTIRNFAVERLFNYLVGINAEIVLVEIEKAFVNTIFERRGIEQHRLMRLELEHLAIPVLYLKDVTIGTHLLADGHHRYVRYAGMGMPHIPAYIAEPKLWNRFIVEGIPEGFAKASLTGHSNIY